jgi:uncharacterized protein (TIGR01244 family)
MRPIPSLAVLVFLAASVTAADGIPDSLDPHEIPNYHRVRPGVATGGQPSAEVLSRLGAMGFKTVINLRTEKEGAKDEETAAKDAGLSYVWVPVTPDTFSLEDVDRVGKVLEDGAAAPVLLHCASANRVGAVWAVLAARRGRTLDEALAEGKEIGLSSPAMVEAVRRVVGGGVSKQ